jgi:hypothetical protein
MKRLIVLVAAVGVLAAGTAASAAAGPGVRVLDMPPSMSPARTSAHHSRTIRTIPTGRCST